MFVSPEGGLEMAELHGNAPSAPIKGAHVMYTEESPSMAPPPTFRVPPYSLEPQYRSMSVWKYLNILFYGLIFLGSLIICTTFSNIFHMFSEQCLLDASLTFSMETSENMTQIRIGQDSEPVVWGQKSQCDFVTFAPVAIACYAFILGYFVFMCEKSHITYGELPQRSALLVIPSFFLGVIVLGILITVLYRAEVGMVQFCANLTSHLNITCYEAQEMPWKDYKYTHGFFDLMVTCRFGAWLSVISTVALLFVLMGRCCSRADFPPYVMEDSGSQLPHPSTSTPTTTLQTSKRFSKLKEEAVCSHNEASTAVDDPLVQSRGRPRHRTTSPETRQQSISPEPRARRRYQIMNESTA